MPALPSVSKVVRVDWHTSETDTLNMMNRMFFQYTGSLSGADAATWVALLRDKFGLWLGAHMSNQVLLYETVLTDLSSSSAPQAINTGTYAFAAGTTSDVAGLCAVIQFKIARRYRGGHPRIYLPGVRTGDVSNLNRLSSTLITNLGTDMAGFVAAIAAGSPAALGTVTHVNVSYFSGFHNVTLPSGRARAVPTLRNTPVVDPVVSYGINPVIGMQRRRIEQP